jgi:hypothetical protein
MLSPDLADVGQTGMSVETRQRMAHLAKSVPADNLLGSLAVCDPPEHAVGQGLPTCSAHLSGEPTPAGEGGTF